MATNGNERLEKLDAALRGAMPVTQAAAPPSAPEDVYDLAERVRETAKAMRDLADYSNHVAGDIERIVAGYIANMNRLLGKAGK